MQSALKPISIGPVVLIRSFRLANGDPLIIYGLPDAVFPTIRQGPRIALHWRKVMILIERAFRFGNDSIRSCIDKDLIKAQHARVPGNNISRVYPTAFVARRCRERSWGRSGSACTWPRIPRRFHNPNTFHPIEISRANSSSRRLRTASRNYRQRQIAPTKTQPPSRMRRQNKNDKEQRQDDAS